jgi:acetolactate synthase I/II/III large subunit
VTTNGEQALLKARTDAGLVTCFVNPGTSEMQLVYEKRLPKKHHPILCLEENGVTGAVATSI